MKLSLAGVIAIVVLSGAAVSSGAWDPNTDPALVAWWAFDEGSGAVAADSSGNNNNGALNGGAQWVAGRFGQAIQFDGSSSYVRAPHIPFDNRNFTILMWINPVLTGSAVVFSTGPAGVDNQDMHIRLGGPSSGDAPVRGIRMGFYNNDLDSPGGFLQDNEWSHIALWYDYDHQNRRIYINGVQRAEASAGPFTGSTGDAIIGYWPTGGQYYKGVIDDVRIYKRALTSAEVKSLVPPVVKATKPNPADGATGLMLPLLQWTPGETALFVDIYLGESPELAAANRVSHQSAMVKLYYHMAYPLLSGQKYYWRVDSIDATGKVFTGDVWSFTTAPTKAFSPTPRDGDKWIDPNSDLTWQPGATAQTHDVYFGTDRNAVAGRDPSVLLGDKQPVAMLELPTLDAGTTYYWLVDEYDVVGTKYEGDVWSFTTNSPGGGVKAEYFRNMTVSGAPFLTQIEPDINHSWGDPGGPAPGVVDQFSARWTADLEIAIADSYTFIATSDDGTRLWLDDQLLVDAWVDRSTTDSFSLPQALEPGVYSLRMEYYENGGGAVAQLSWQTPTLARQIIPAGPLQPPVRAKPINPRDNDVNVPQDVVLMWSAGEKAVSHDIYFGDDEAVVAAATPADGAVFKGNQALEDNSFAPGPLEWNKTYYWRIDEVNDADTGSPWKSSVWSFTTADFIVVDNFDSYVDEVEGRIFQTWIDGWGYTEPAPGNPGNGTCSTVGYTDPPFAENVIVRSGQSMPFDYNNTVQPYYSETDRTWTTAQNWKVNGVNTLVLYFQGYPARYLDDGTTITISAAGDDIWNNADAFRFAYKKLSGDGSITAKVNSIVQTNVWAKAGVMIRESLAPGSANVANVVSAASGVSFQYRAFTDDVSYNTGTSGLAAPYWIRLTRTGNTFKGEMSADGKTWTTVGTDATLNPSDVVLGSNIYIGLCVTSHNTNPKLATTGVFSDVKTTGGVSGQWQVADIGMNHPGNDPAQMYVALQDSAGKLAVVVNPDAQAVLSTTWTEWKIPTSEFTGVNLGAVKKMFIGIGDRAAPQVGGHGMLFIDDIRVVK